MITEAWNAERGWGPGPMPAEAFEVGERASREHDGEKRICEIIERKQLPNGQWSYYVHFEGLNRRLDSWLQAE